MKTATIIKKLKRWYIVHRLWSEYNNPYYYWWKMRKYFKPPKFKLAHIGRMTWFFGLPIRNTAYNPILSIKLCGLGWKTKYESTRHEWDPYLIITFFRRWQILFVWTYKNTDVVESISTWEAILDMYCYNETLTAVYNRHQWIYKEKVLTIKDNLTDKAKSEINE